jgi:hypothetical protein
LNDFRGRAAGRGRELRHNKTQNPSAWATRKRGKNVGFFDQSERY